MMRKLLLITAVVFLFLTANAYAQEADIIAGKWLTEKKDSAVEIYKCADKYCGKIIWLSEPKNEDGTDKVDDKNPDESKKNQKIIGLNIVWDFIHKGGKKWGDGKIYDPENGKTYSCKMKLEDDGKLNLRGYVGVSLFGRTTVWTRNSKK